MCNLVFTLCRFKTSRWVKNSLECLRNHSKLKYITCEWKHEPSAAAPLFSTADSSEHRDAGRCPAAVVLKQVEGPVAETPPEETC